MKFLLFVSILLFYGCHSGTKDSLSSVTQDDIVKLYKIEMLKDETYYFPAKKNSTDSYTYQALKRFDMIFVGHDSNSTSRYLSYATPGKYTHVLLYIGKDSDGFAYAVEMNGLEKGILNVDANGFDTAGRLFVYCLGDDYANNSCPNDEYIHGIETYDFMWAKSLNEELYTQLKQHEKELLSTIKEDLLTAYPTQLALHIGVETLFSKVILLVDDGRANGADCTAYIVSLFEEIAGVCMDNIRINAEELESYYRNDPVGRLSVLPAQYNPFSSSDIYISTLLDEKGYHFVDNEPRQSLCSDKRMLTGVPTPDLLFNSPSLIDIYSK